MALAYDQLSSITLKFFIPKLVDNIFKSNALLLRLNKKGSMKVDGGLKINQPIYYKKLTAAGEFAGYDLLDTTPNETRTTAEYDWAHYYCNISISRDDELKNSGKSQIINLVKDEVQLAELTLKDKMGEHLFLDYVNAKRLIGLQKVCKSSDTSNPLGGISTADFSGWAAVVDSTTATMTIASLQSLFGSLTEDTNKPTIILSNQTNFNRYFALLDDNKRYVNTEVADAGFTTLSFNGIPWIVDSHSPVVSGKDLLFMLNEDYLKLAVHPQENFRFEPFQKPTNQAVNVAKIYWMGQVLCSNRRFQGIMTNLSA